MWHLANGSEGQHKNDGPQYWQLSSMASKRGLIAPLRRMMAGAENRGEAAEPLLVNSRPPNYSVGIINMCKHEKASR
jgi:hypothetical protein